MKKIADKRKELQRLRRVTEDDTHITHSQATYYYVWGLFNGKRVCLGPYASEDEAWNIIYGKNIQGDVEPLRTRDQATATRILKAKSLNDESVTLDAALQRVRHKGVDL